MVLVVHDKTNCNELTHHRRTTEWLVAAATDGSIAECWAAKRRKIHV